MSANSQDRRAWRPRFSLRALVAFTVVVGCGSGWLAVEIQRAEAQQRAVAHIRGVRGHATYDYQLEPEAEWPGAKLIRRMMGNDFLSQVRRVSIHDACDRDLEHLLPLSGLKDLRLNSRQITDEGARHLRDLRKLERLDLWCNQITDESLQYVGALEELETLDLLGTQVTDAGLLQLHGLVNLRVLKLRNTKVTPAGHIRLLRLLPDCQVSGVDSSDEPPAQDQPVSRNVALQEGPLQILRCHQSRSGAWLNFAAQCLR